MRQARLLLLAVALVAAVFATAPNAQAVESATPPIDQENACELLGCECFGSFCCCSYECHPGGDWQDCW